MKNQCPSEGVPDLIRINIKDVLDYCWCPLYYDLKKNDKYGQNFKEMYDNALHKCFYSYLIALQNNNVNNGLEYLKIQWGKTWIKQKRNSELICTPSAHIRDTYDGKRKAGINAILTFDDMMNNTPQYPIIINKPFEIQISSDIILTGVWEYVREIERDGKNIFQIIKFKTESSHKVQTKHQMQHDLELTAATYAFKETFNVSDFEIVYFDLFKKKMISSYRTEKDYKLLKDTVTSVVFAMKHNLKLTSPDKRCYHCEYRNACVNKLL